MIKLDESELNALYLDLVKKNFGVTYCTFEELIQFKRNIMDLSLEAGVPVVAFGSSGSSYFYSDGTHVSIIPEAQDILVNSLIRSYSKLSQLDESILKKAFLETVKMAIVKDEEKLHDKKLKFLQLSYEDKSKLRK